MAGEQDPRFWVPPFRGLVSGRATPGPFEPAPFAVPPEVTVPDELRRQTQLPAAPTPQPPALFEPLPPEAPASARAAIDVLRGATLGATGPEDTWWAKGTELGMAALPFVGPAKGAALTGARKFLPGTKGLYSRVDEALRLIPAKGAPASKIANLLRDNASAEEVAWRKIPEFLASKGNAIVTPAEFEAHLAANPAPVPKVMTLGGALPVEQRGGQWVVDYPDGSVRTFAREDEARAVAESGTVPPKYNRQELRLQPAGERYREMLVHLPDPFATKWRSLTERLEAKLAEIRELPKIHEMKFDSPEQYYASPEYARMQQLIAEHNALNDEMRALPPAPPGYVEPHYGGSYPENILGHSRYDERLVSEGAPPVLPPGYQVVPATSVHGQYYYLAPPGAPPQSVDSFSSIEEATRAAMAHAGSPGVTRVRHIDELQSKLHQQGARQGYVTPALTPEQQARSTQLLQEIEAEKVRLDAAHAENDRLNEIYLDQLRDVTRRHLPPEYAHLSHFGEALTAGEQATAAWRAARDRGHRIVVDFERQAKQAESAMYEQATRVRALETELGQLNAITTPTAGKVPDLPFKKDAWMDLLLKQHVLDVAHDPNVDVLSLSSGKTQAQRYNLADWFDKIEFHPDSNDPRDFTRGSLVGIKNGDEIIRHDDVDPADFIKYMEKTQADALTKQIEQHAASRKWEREQWSVEPDTDRPGRFNIVDPNGEVVHDWGGEPVSYGSAVGAEQHIDELLRGEYSGGPPDAPSISGKDLQFGEKWPFQLYDERARKRLEKILKPFGGTVEAGGLPKGDTWKNVEAPGFRLVDSDGREFGVFGEEQVAQEQMRHVQRAYPTVRIVPTNIVSSRRVPQTPEPSWFARFSPEMKARIRKEGLSLMSLGLFGVGSSLVGNQPLSSPGAPPVSAPPDQQPH